MLDDAVTVEMGIELNVSQCTEKYAEGKPNPQTGGTCTEQNIMMVSSYRVHIRSQV